MTKYKILVYVIQSNFQLEISHVDVYESLNVARSLKIFNGPGAYSMAHNFILSLDETASVRHKTLVLDPIPIIDTYPYGPDQLPF